jgi:lipid A 3-O-deacylase
MRFGRVLTHEIGHGALRGSFEAALDIIPINEFWIGGNAQYAGAIDPLIGKWNFTAGKTVAPYIAAVGGIVFSPNNLPPGDTSQVNFTSGAELGAQWFRQSRNSWDFAVKIYHLSNASIGNKNPGINGAVQFMVGYTWH